MREHPNATFVFSTTPLTTLIGYLAARFGVALPQAVAVAVGSIASGGLLIFRGAIQKAAEAVWANGIRGCCRRVWKGAPPS